MNLTAEEKMVSSSKNVNIALAMLKHHCRDDEHYAAGTVNSIYYDTYKFDSVTEKTNGDYLKQKVRLRWYEIDGQDIQNKNGMVTCFLECKKKIGSKRVKGRVPLEFKAEQLLGKSIEAQRILADLPLSYQEQLQINNAGLLRPVLRVSYTRNRYVCPISESRICLDRDIYFQRFDNGGNQRANSALSQIVLEVKDGKVENCPWLMNLRSIGFRFESFSKYEECFLSSSPV